MERHPTDLLSLLSGVFFLAIGLFALLDVGGLALSVNWIWPVGLMLVGVAVLAGARRHSDEP